MAYEYELTGPRRAEEDLYSAPPLSYCSWDYHSESRVYDICISGRHLKIRKCNQRHQASTAQGPARSTPTSRPYSPPKKEPELTATAPPPTSPPQQPQPTTNAPKGEQNKPSQSPTPRPKKRLPASAASPQTFSSRSSNSQQHRISAGTSQSWKSGSRRCSTHGLRKRCRSWALGMFMLRSVRGFCICGPTWRGAGMVRGRGR